MIAQGDIYWIDLPAPAGSSPGFRRPVVVVQGDSLNQSNLATTICVLVTSNLRLASAKGNALLRARTTGLPQDSVANVSQILTVDKSRLEQHIGRVSSDDLDAILAGIDIVLGR